MINITNPSDCCGCSACVQRCPKCCIAMQEDAEGFLYPIVDKTMCVECGLCEKVCPLINRADAVLPMRVVAARNVDDEERLCSSSGGIFIELAKQVLERGGVVFGAVFDEKWEVKITYGESLETVRNMMGSKYVQARVENSYRDAERILRQGQEVLFTGSPCQIAGLHGYLRRSYSNLLTVDFLCHGVPSPGVWRRYLKELLVQNHATKAATGRNSILLSLDSISSIEGIEFRNKRKGWKKYSFVLTLVEVTTKGEKNTVLFSRMHRNEPYMKGFMSDVYLRPSCFNCRCKNGVSHSDITIADYWGVNGFMPDLDDDKGVSLVQINTDKGLRHFDDLSVLVRGSSFEDAKSTNPGFKALLTPHPKRDEFYRRFSHGNETIEMILKDILYFLYTRKWLQMSNLLSKKQSSCCYLKL